MAWLFGKAKKPVVDTTLERSEELSRLIERLSKKEDFIDKQIAEQREKARGFASKGDKRRAVECLKRVKVLETNRERYSQYRANLEIQKDQIHEAVISAEVFTAYRRANETVKQAFGNLDADAINDIIDDMDETRAQMNEISEALGRPQGPMMDEDEIEMELAALQEEAGPARIPAVAAPAAEPEAEDLEDDDAEALQGLMASYGA